jgi:signal transduction histidine kinase
VIAIEEQGAAEEAQAQSRRGQPPGAVDSMRAAVFGNTLTGLALTGFSVCVLIFYQASVGDYLGADVWMLTGLTVGLVLLRLLHTRLGYRRGTRLLLALLAFACSLTLVFGQLAPGLGLVQVMFVFIALLFSGRRAGIAALIFCLVTLTVTAIGVTTGHLEPSNAEYWNPKLAVVWVRYALLLGLFGGTFALAHSSILQSLEASLITAQQAIERERQERIKREQMQTSLEKSRRMEALGQLAAGIAHDFNNALTVILASSELLREKSSVASPHLGELAAEIHDTALTAAGTARRLLSLGSSEDARPEPAAVDNLLRPFEATLKRLMPTMVSCRTEVRSSGEVFVDLQQMQQALLNLAINARDAMPEGGEFVIEVADSEITEPPPGWRAKAGLYVVIACRDTGIGIDEITLERIFEPFFTTKTSGKGTGLGLAMVRRTIYDACGFVSVRSAPGHGTTVRLCLPRAHETQLEVAAGE